METCTPRLTNVTARAAVPTTPAQKSAWKRLPLRVAPEEQGVPTTPAQKSAWKLVVVMVGVVVVVVVVRAKIAEKSAWKLQTRRSKRT